MRTAFAGATHALRALAHSMARESLPKNTHDAYRIADRATGAALNRVRRTLPVPLDSIFSLFAGTFVGLAR